MTEAVLRAAVLAAAGWAASAAVDAWVADRRLNGRPPSRDRSGRLVGLALAAGALAGRRVTAHPLVGRVWPGAGERLLDRAGRPPALAGDGVGRLRAGATALLAAVAALAVSLAPGPVTALAGAAVVGFGGALPELWLRSLAARRAEAIERWAPPLLDLVAACVRAGVDVDRALAAAATAVRGPLRDELEASAGSLALGRPRAAELADLAARTGSPALAGLAAALRTADELGTPPADGLARQAAEARAERARAVERRAALAGPRIVLVVVFVLVPAALLPLAAAVALAALESLGSLTGAPSPPR